MIDAKRNDRTHAKTSIEIGHMPKHPLK